MPEAFIEAFVAVILLHGSYRGSFHGGLVLKASVEENYYFFSNLLFTSTKASVKASVKAFVEANLLPRKLP